MLLAGPKVPRGSSRAEEAELLAREPRLGNSVIDFGAVSDAEKAWLLGRVRLVLYPTVYEGFGLVPFEAARHGVPCIWAPGTSLREVLPAGATELAAWDAEQSADRALELMRADGARERQLRSIREAATELSWDAAATQLLELYEATCDAPTTARRALAVPLGGALSEDAMRLIGPGGALSEDVQRTLVAIATHRALAVPLFGTMKLGYRAAYRLSRWTGAVRRRQLTRAVEGSRRNY